MEKPDLTMFESKHFLTDEQEPQSYWIWEEKNGLKRFITTDSHPQSTVVCMCDGTSKSVRECLNATLVQAMAGTGHRESIKSCCEGGVNNLNNKFLQTINPPWIP